ncbi:hypothetical protein M2650_01860 [Luteimonas sp. SX5]|uniref:Uncharacterized protein n=1 Tax=Luteimonas galliterrae TaxID=2940486 RepID=A0ABT0MEV1_9GAMM|nr:hypothetical protein [Luteimonas galliterrae]MCL1633393.1 hypothetical protein [Luteimonas galliterrae]
MARSAWIIVLAAIAVLFIGQWLAADQAKSKEPAVQLQTTAAIAEAKAGGVEIGKPFDFTAQKADLVKKLVDADAVEGACSIECPGNKVGGISCPVGKMCQCSCPGGGPDCSCR